MNKDAQPHKKDRYHELLEINLFRKRNIDRDDSYENKKKFNMRLNNKDLQLLFDHEY